MKSECPATMSPWDDHPFASIREMQKECSKLVSTLAYAQNSAAYCGRRGYAAWVGLSVCGFAQAAVGGRREVFAGWNKTRLYRESQRYGRPGNFRAFCDDAG